VVDVVVETVVVVVGLAVVVVTEKIRYAYEATLLNLLSSLNTCHIKKLKLLNKELIKKYLLYRVPGTRTKIHDHFSYHPIQTR